MADIEFVDGLIIKAPHERAPEYVKASISIKVLDLRKWLRAKSDAGADWVNVDVKEAKSGKWYAAVSQYKKEQAAPEKPAPKRAGSIEEMENDIPF